MDLVRHRRPAPHGAMRERYRADVAEALTSWRLGVIPPRPNWSVGRELFRAGVAEILALRLRVAYMPLLQGLQRIEDRVNILTQIRAEPYAPPSAPYARPQLTSTRR